MKPFLWGEVFEPLYDPEVFRQVRVDEELGTIVGDNGADLCPDFLHDFVSEAAEPIKRQ